MKTLDDIESDLKQWGYWQRTNTPSSLNYAIMQCSVSIGQSNVTPVYRDIFSENLDLIIRQYLEKPYRTILVLSFVEQLSNLDAAIKLNLAKTTYKTRRREAMAIMMGLSCINNLDRPTTKP